MRRFARKHLTTAGRERCERISRQLSRSGRRRCGHFDGGAVQYVNPAFSRITGYSQAEVVGKTSPLSAALRGKAMRL